MLPLDVTDEMLKAPKNPLTDLVPVWTSYWQLIKTFATLVFGWVVGVDVTVAERTDQQCAYRSGGSLRNWRWCRNILRARAAILGLVGTGARAGAWESGGVGMDVLSGLLGTIGAGAVVTLDLGPVVARERRPTLAALGSVSVLLDVVVQAPLGF